MTFEEIDRLTEEAKAGIDKKRGQGAFGLWECVNSINYGLKSEKGDIEALRRRYLQRKRQQGIFFNDRMLEALDIVEDVAKKNNFSNKAPAVNKYSAAKSHIGETDRELWTKFCKDGSWLLRSVENLSQCKDYKDVLNNLKLDEGTKQRYQSALNFYQKFMPEEGQQDFMFAAYYVAGAATWCASEICDPLEIDYPDRLPELRTFFSGLKEMSVITKLELETNDYNRQGVFVDSIIKELDLQPKTRQIADTILRAEALNHDSLIKDFLIMARNAKSRQAHKEPAAQKQIAEVKSVDKNRGNSK